MNMQVARTKWGTFNAVETITTGIVSNFLAGASSTCNVWSKRLGDELNFQLPKVIGEARDCHHTALMSAC